MKILSKTCVSWALFTLDIFLIGRLVDAFVSESMWMKLCLKQQGLSFMELDLFGPTVSADKVVGVCLFLWVLLIGTSGVDQ